MNWLTVLLFIVSIMIAGCSGVVIAAILITGKRADEQMEKWCEEKNTYESN